MDLDEIAFEARIIESAARHKIRSELLWLKISINIIDSICTSSRILVETISKMNNLLIQLLVFVIGLVATIVIFRYLFLKSDTGQLAFESKDGTKFKDEESLIAYEELVEKVALLYASNDPNNTKRRTDLFRMKPAFIDALTKDGFKDPKTLISFTAQFKALLELLETEVE